MNNILKEQKKFKGGLSPFKVTAIYALMGALWILFSDHILGSLVSNPGTLIHWQTLKGWLYVITTAGLLYVLIHRNIAAIRSSEEAVRQSEERFRNLSEEISDGISITIDGKNYWVNKAFSDISGYTRKELIGKGVDFIIVPEEVPLFIERMKDRLAGKDVPSNYETIAKRKDAKRINIDVSAKLINFEGKQAIQIVVRDITERKRAEDHIQHLQSVLKAIRNINQQIVHEKNQQRLLQEA